MTRKGFYKICKELAIKKAIINMKNADNRVFLWWVLRVLNPKDIHPERVDTELKEKENTLNMKGIEYPVSLKISTSLKSKTHLYPSRYSDSRKNSSILLDDNVYEPKLVSYTREDAAQKFVNMLEEDIIKISNIPKKKLMFGEKIIKKKKHLTRKLNVGYVTKNSTMMLKMTRSETIAILLVNIEELLICNFLYRKPNFTPVVFHNLGGYHSRLFMKNLGSSDGSIDCIPNNEERYTSFTKKIQVGSYKKKIKNKKVENEKEENEEGETEKEETEEGETEEEGTEEKTIPLYHQIRSIDSFKFLATSLEKLVNNLSNDAFDNVRRYYAEDELDLLSRKGIYPYEYMDSPEKLKETQLPPKETWLSGKVFDS